MVILDAGRRRQRVPPLAKWSLGVGIVATVGANVAHGLDHGPVGALVSAWPALALVGSFELLMTLTRNAASSAQTPERADQHPAASTSPDRARAEVEQQAEKAVLADYLASLDGPGKPLSQRALAERHGIDRRKVKQIITTVAQD
jgi:hypothetical protein